MTSTPVVSMTLYIYGVIGSLDAGSCRQRRRTATPNWKEIVTIVLLGLGPAGGAFFLRGLGMRRGNAATHGIFSISAKR